MQGERVPVLGIGNLLWADEGFGVRAVEVLRDNYTLDDSVTLMDGGTQGIYLVQCIRDADILIVFDAVDYRLPGGTPKRVEGAEVPGFLGCKTERPSDMQACRKGNARVLHSKDFHLAYRPASIDGLNVELDQHLNNYREQD